MKCDILCDKLKKMAELSATSEQHMNLGIKEGQTRKESRRHFAVFAVARAKYAALLQEVSPVLFPLLDLSCKAGLLRTFITDAIFQIVTHDADPGTECPFLFEGAELEGSITLRMDESALENLPKPMTLEDIEEGEKISQSARAYKRGFQK